MATATLGKTRLRKVECTACGCIGRFTIGALRRAGGMPVCACGGIMTLDSLDDAMLVSDSVGQAHPDFAAMVGREVRSANRDATRLTYSAMHCGGCQRIVKASNEWCSCGFRNDIRGRRNYGAWADGGNQSRDMPF